MMNDGRFGMGATSHPYIINYDVPFRNGKAKLLQIPVNYNLQYLIYKNSHFYVSSECSVFHTQNMFLLVI